jgi:class 3 adenylate cyclase
MVGKPQPVPASPIRRYGVFVKLWDLTPKTSAPDYRTLINTLDQALLSMRSGDDWFPSPYGGAIIFEEVGPAISSALSLQAWLKTHKVAASIAITWGLFHKVPNIYRWNVVAIAMNTAARIASFEGAKGKVLVDREVARHGQEAGLIPGKYKLGAKQREKVKATWVNFHELIPNEAAPAADVLTALPEMAVVAMPPADIALTADASTAEMEVVSEPPADIICFDIQAYSQKTVEQQEGLVTDLSRAVGRCLKEVNTSTDLFESAGDGGYLAFREDRTAAAWQFARNLRETAAVSGIPLRIGIHTGIVTSANHRDAVGGSVIRTDQVSAMPPAGCLAVTETFWNSLHDPTFKAQFRETRARQDPEVLILISKNQPAWTWLDRKLALVVAKWILAAAALVFVQGVEMNDYPRNVFLAEHLNWSAKIDEQQPVWNSPAGLSVSHDDLAPALVLPPSSWASFGHVDENPVSDFVVRFRLSFGESSGTSGTRAEWVLRSQLPPGDRPRTLSAIPGYHFQLKQEQGTAGEEFVIYGSTVNSLGDAEPLDPKRPDHSISLTGCCTGGQAVLIHATVIGHRIVHCRALQDLNSQPDPGEVGAIWWDDATNGFFDRGGTFDRGGIVIGAGSEEVRVSDVVVFPPPDRTLKRCFLLGYYCRPLGSHNECP